MAVADTPFKIHLGKRHGHFARLKDPQGPDTGVGTFLIEVAVTALAETLYVPTSIASGKKPTGFVYQIEGTGRNAIATTSIAAAGAGIMQITLGTIVYTKIPKGMTATFRIAVEIRGQIGREYRIVINRMHYKRDPSDPRYLRYAPDIRSSALSFR